MEFDKSSLIKTIRCITKIQASSRCRLGSITRHDTNHAVPIFQTSRCWLTWQWSGCNYVKRWCRRFCVTVKRSCRLNLFAKVGNGRIDLVRKMRNRRSYLISEMGYSWIKFIRKMGNRRINRSRVIGSGRLDLIGKMWDCYLHFVAKVRNGRMNWVSIIGKGLIGCKRTTTIRREMGGSFGWQSCLTVIPNSCRSSRLKTGWWDSHCKRNISIKRQTNTARYERNETK